MRIVCPSCQATYQVPDKLLSGPPRKVRCARCGADWLPEPAAKPPAGPSAPPPDLAVPPPQPPDKPSAAPPEPFIPRESLPPPPPLPPLPTEPQHVAMPRAAQKLAPNAAAAGTGRGQALLLGLGWAASAALLGAAGWAVLARRADIVALWAPSRRLYQWLGLGLGLE